MGELRRTSLDRQLELTDAEILYSAATLVGATVQAGMADADVEKN